MGIIPLTTAYKNINGELFLIDQSNLNALIGMHKGLEKIPDNVIVYAKRCILEDKNGINLPVSDKIYAISAANVEINCIGSLEKIEIRLNTFEIDEY